VEDCYINQGKVYTGFGDYEKAIGNYTEAIRLYPGDTDIIFFGGALPMMIWGIMKKPLPIIPGQ
jgi:tetratricopeptide (TPR) repeat protein